MIRNWDKNQLVAALAPLVMPLIRDRCQISTPIPGNYVHAKVTIRHGTDYVTLTPEQYEILRTEVLQPVQDKFSYTPMYEALGESEVERIIQQRLEEAFADA